MGRPVRVFSLWRWVNGGALVMVSFKETTERRKRQKNEGKVGKSLSLRVNLRREGENESDGQKEKRNKE